jgi:hypothetical protein
MCRRRKVPCSHDLLTSYRVHGCCRQLRRVPVWPYLFAEFLYGRAFVLSEGQIPYPFWPFSRHSSWPYAGSRVSSWAKRGLFDARSKGSELPGRSGRWRTETTRADSGFSWQAIEVQEFLSCWTTTLTRLIFLASRRWVMSLASPSACHTGLFSPPKSNAPVQKPSRSR